MPRRPRPPKRPRPLAARPSSGSVRYSGKRPLLTLGGLVWPVTTINGTGVLPSVAHGTITAAEINGAASFASTPHSQVTNAWFERGTMHATYEDLAWPS